MLNPTTFLVVALLAAVTTSGADACSITIDGKTYQLEGVDQPDVDQICLNEDGKSYACGIRAREELQRFIAGRTVKCTDLRADPAFPKRRMGDCSVDGVDLQHWLVLGGWALSAEPDAKGRYKGDEDDARAGRFGLWKGCFVAPADFRGWNRRSAKLLGPGCPADARDKLFPDETPMPAGCAIKGHYATRAWPSKGIYHLPECGSYRRTKAKRWFCTEDDALAAGFRKAYTCGWW